MGAPRRVLLAWEGGAGRGHILTLKAIAEALGDGLIYDAALCRMQHAGEIAPLCELVFKGAVLWTNDARRQAVGNPRAATWGEFLGDLNFGDPQFLITQIGWWLATIKARQSALVVADFAPCAVLAARLAGIPAVTIGTGYSAPPPQLADFPILLPEHAQRIHDEAQLLASVNAALAHFGGQPLSRLPEIYGGALSLPRTIAELDPYHRHRATALLPPLNEAADPSAEIGDEVFAYLSTTERNDPALMAAIANLGVPVRLFMPDIDDATAAALTQTGITLERSPVPIADIARRTRLMLHSGQHGSLCMALGLGLVQIAVPQHLEQLYHARRTAELGSLDIIAHHALDAPAICATILRAYHDIPRHEAARALATRLAPALSGDIHGQLRHAILPLLGIEHPFDVVPRRYP